MSEYNKTYRLLIEKILERVHGFETEPDSRSIHRKSGGLPLRKAAAFFI